jgi:prepilin-type processing-associated H-X9-DG protein
VGNATITNSECWGWSALILPFMEQPALHDQLGVSKQTLEYGLATGGATFRQLAQTPLETYICPSDTGYNKPGQVHNNRHFNGGLGTGTPTPNYLPGVSSYLGVEGHRDITNDVLNTGIFFGNSGITMADVLDGTSNTIAVGERDSFDCRSGSWVGVRNPNGTNERGVHTSVGHSHPKLNQPNDAVIPWDEPRIGCGEGFSSLHPGGAQFVLCDGSVRFLSETIEHFWHPNTIVNGSIADSKNVANATYQRLMTRDDRLPVSGF